MNLLPELWIIIGKQLNIYSLYNLATTSKPFFKLCSTNDFWGYKNYSFYHYVNEYIVNDIIGNIRFKYRYIIKSFIPNSYYLFLNLMREYNYKYTLYYTRANIIGLYINNRYIEFNSGERLSVNVEYKSVKNLYKILCKLCDLNIINPKNYININ